jgi:hypothetical protein
VRSEDVGLIIGSSGGGGECELRLKPVVSSSTKIIKLKQHHHGNNNKKHKGYSSGGIIYSNTNYAMNGSGRLFVSDGFNFNNSGRVRPNSSGVYEQQPNSHPNSGSEVWQYGGHHQPDTKFEPTASSSMNSVTALNTNGSSSLSDHLNMDYLVELEKIFERNFGIVSIEFFLSVSFLIKLTNKQRSNDKTSDNHAGEERAGEVSAGAARGDTKRVVTGGACRRPLPVLLLSQPHHFSLHHDFLLLAACSQQLVTTTTHKL